MPYFSKCELVELYTSDLSLKKIYCNVKPTMAPEELLVGTIGLTMDCYPLTFVDNVMWIVDVLIADKLYAVSEVNVRKVV